MSAGAPPGVRRPPLPLLALLGASLSMAVLTAGHAREYVKSWSRQRAGKTIAEQRATLGRRPGMPTSIVPWFDPAFVEFVDDLRATLPPDARVLVEPEPGEIADESGRGRWFLYLNYFAYPLRFYVRKPAFAGGTLVDYGKWLAHHLKQKDVVRLLDEEVAIEERGIDHKLVFGVTRDFARDTVKLFRRDGTEWRRVRIVSAAAAAADDGDGDGEPAEEADGAR